MLRVLGLAWLVCGFATAYVLSCGVQADAASTDDCFQKTCWNKKYDIREAVCCEKSLYPGVGLSCCGSQAFHPSAATCCEGNVTKGLSEKVSACCGKTAYDELNELCCDSTVVTKPAENAICCGKEAVDANEHLCCGPYRKKLTPNSSNHRCCGADQYDITTECCCETLEKRLKNNSSCNVACGTETFDPFTELLCGQKVFDDKSQMCCGPENDRRIVPKIPDHQCCGHGLFHTITECCCDTGGTLRNASITSRCCVEEQCVPQQSLGNNPKCTSPQTSVCGSSCYDPKEFRCCERKLRSCVTGRCDADPIVYNPCTHVCCDGRVSERKLWSDQFHGSSKHHYCGTKHYQPDTEICCNGRRHDKKNMNCCGVQAYSITSQEMKCCAGTLYNLTKEGVPNDAKCCGSVLQKPQDVCCSNEDEKLLYSKKTGHECCGHLYYNSLLWACCAGTLRPLNRSENQSNTITLQSVSNLNKTDLCKEWFIGTVESMSMHSIVFISVLEINGINATVHPRPSPYVLKTSDNCSFPKLIPGVTYLFDKEVLSDINHDSFLQLLHFMMSECKVTVG